MIPTGNYKAKATEAALGFTKEGSPQVAVAFQILEPGEQQGQSITWFGFFTDLTQARTIESLRTCGWRTDDLSDLAGVTDNEVVIVVKHEEYNGETRAKVAWVNRLGGVALQSRMRPDEAKKFAQTMMGSVLAQKQRATAGPGPAKPSAPPPPRAPAAPPPSREPAPEDAHAGATGTDDIPF